MEYRRAQTGDFEQIVDLQNRNLAWNLSAAERSGGFLSTAFTSEQFQEMDRSAGVAVCVEEGRVRGYLCAAAAEFYKAFPLPAAMLEKCSGLSYKGKPVVSYNFFVANPICIDKDCRGTGVYMGLRNKILELVSKDYSLALTFIADENQPSLKASPKAGWEIIGEFKSGVELFWILAVPVGAGV